MFQTIPLTPADRFALIIEGMCKAVAGRSDPRRYGLNCIAGTLIILIRSRLRRLVARFARHAATPAIPSRPAKPRPARLRQSQPYLLPRRKAWLLRLVPETASGASQLRHFLSEPDTAALLEAAPQLGRILRPLCHMLGVRPTQALRLPSSQPSGAPPAASPIPRDAPPQAAPVTVLPAALPPWPTPPSPDTPPPALQSST